MTCKPEKLIGVKNDTATATARAINYIAFVKYVIQMGLE